MKKALFVDGNWLMHRSFHAIASSVSNAQKRVPLQMLGYFCEFALELQCKYGALVFDGPDNFRKKIYPEYKKSRSGSKADFVDEGSSKDEVYSCMQPAMSLFSRMGIPVFQHPNLEADDMSASGAFWFTRDNERQYKKDHIAYIGVPDKDSIQRVDQQVFIYRPKVGKTPAKIYHKEDVIKKYGVSPRQFIDLQILCGDGVDDIPSILGKAEAKNILTTHGNLHNFFKTKEGKKFFKANATELIRNRSLAVLDYLSWKPTTEELELHISANEGDMYADWGRLPKSVQALRSFTSKSRKLFG